MLRDHGEPHATMQQLSQAEQVLGDYGGQLASFEWVFSPRGPDGRSAQLFNRTTGDIDPKVANYWREHYDIVERLKTNWNTIGPDLKGKIHLFVGTDDTFYLDGAAHGLLSTLDQLGERRISLSFPAETTSISISKAQTAMRYSIESQPKCTA